jgi:hypothetical protein
LEATDELIIRLLGVVAKIRTKYVSDHFIFLFLREEAQMPFTHVQEEKKKKKKKERKGTHRLRNIESNSTSGLRRGMRRSRRSVG